MGKKLVKKTGQCYTEIYDIPVQENSTNQSDQGEK